METPPVENKSRKRQLSEEQPSGNGVKKPKVSVWGLGIWLLSVTLGMWLAGRYNGGVRRDSQVAAAGHDAGPGCCLLT